MAHLISLCSALILLVSGVSSVHGAVDVFVSIPPQKWLAEKIGAEMINCRVLVDEGRDPHTFEPTPRQIKALSHARIWFTMGMEFEDRLIRKIQDAAPGLQIVDTAHYIEKRRMRDHGKEDNDTHHGHPHGGKGLDPHVWLSPSNLEKMSAEMTGALSESDAENSRQYAQNYRVVSDELNRLDESIRGMLKPYRGATFYVFHPSFGYFADSYDLIQEPIEIEGKSPSPRQLSRVIKKARKDGVKIIFVQPQFDPKSAGAVAAAIGGSVVPLDALAENVEKNLRTIAARIENALN